MNNPPFYIGQRVVAIKNHSQGVFKKGDEFTVTSILKNPCCGAWVITVGIQHLSNLFDCSRCGADNQPIIGNEWTFSSRIFAPIEENRIKYVAVSETLREKAVEIAAIETN